MGAELGVQPLEWVGARSKKEVELIGWAPYACLGGLVVGDGNWGRIVPIDSIISIKNLRFLRTEG